MMVSLGWAYPPKQVRRHSTDVEGRNLWRSEAAVRRLNLQRLCDMTGTSWLLKRDRMHADQVRGQGTASFVDAQQRREEASRGRSVGKAARAAPPATGDPPVASKNGTQHIADILTLLK
ncbi:conserved hypothetical protein [Xanthomonas citri pv. citri]|nr:conserved hypothetical protein [Xanthomonas citri pv. citri]